MNCYTGGQNIISGIEDIHAKTGADGPTAGPQILPRQIFDLYIEPVYGLLYIMMRNRDSYLRVIYGNQQDFRMLVVDPDAASACKNITEKIMQTAGGRRPQDLERSSNASDMSYRLE